MDWGIKEIFNKDLEELKNRQSAMNNTIIEIKNTLVGTTSRITEAEEQTSELEDRMVEINEAEQKKRMKRNENSLRDLWDNIKYSIWIIGVPEEDKSKGYENIFEEIIVKIFPKMGKELATQFKKAKRVSYRINLGRNMPRHILIKLTATKYKEQMLKAEKEKQQVSYKGIS